MDFKEIALEYIEQGYSVTPVKDKRPYINEWQKLVEEEVLEPKYDKSWKGANGLGVILGEVSGVICFDVDILEGNEKLKEIREELEKFLPPIMCGKIGNPAKPPARFFKYNGERSQKFKELDIEILSNGNQAVIPPSHNHVSKTEYQWVGKPLNEIDQDDLPDLPEKLVGWLTQKNEEFKEANKKKKSGPKQHNQGTSEGLKMMEGRCKSGSHNRLSSIGVGMFIAGIAKDEVVQRLKDIDRFINEEADEFYFTCPSRKHKSDNYHQNAVAFVDEIFERNKGKKPDRLSIDEYYKQEIKEGFTIMDPEKDKGYIRKHFSLYGYMNHYHDLTYVPEMKQFMFYNVNKYERLVEDEIKYIAQKYFKFPRVIKPNERSIFLELCRTMKKGKARDYLSPGYRKANFLNGTYSLKSRKLSPHSRRDRFNLVIPVDFKADGNAPVWEELLYLITMGRKHLCDVLEEFIGYCIFGMPYDEYNKLLILDGGGSNGKSTLIRVIKGILGDENCSSVALESISKDRFSGSSLLNKLVNFCAEEPKEAFANTGALKKLTGGDPIMIEEKHKGAFQFTNMAKMIISYNKMPFFPDDSTGMKRRIILVPCDQNFEDHPERKIHRPYEQIMENEVSQVLYRCMRAFERVVDRKAFTETPEGASRVDEMILESNPIKMFIAECCEFQEGEFATLEQVWSRFTEYAGDRTKYTKIGFSRSFKTEMNALNFEYSRGTRGTRGYKNLACYL